MGPFLVQRPYRSPQVLFFNLTALCSCALHDCTVVLFRVQISHPHVNHATAPKAPDYSTSCEKKHCAFLSKRHKIRSRRGNMV